MTAAIKSVEAQEFQPVKKKKRAPVKKSESSDSESKLVNVFEGLPTPKEAEAEAKAIPSPYPEGVSVWVYQPKDEKLAPIVLPTSGFQPTNKLWHFDLAQLPILAQTWKWMDRANVPKAIQRQTQLLDDGEYFAMFNEWLAIVMSDRAPKGAVTAGK
jgi:hypothetical protein